MVALKVSNKLLQLDEPYFEPAKCAAKSATHFVQNELLRMRARRLAMSFEVFIVPDNTLVVSDSIGEGREDNGCSF
jgi:hypothetical protein